MDRPGRAGPAKTGFVPTLRAKPFYSHMASAKKKPALAVTTLHIFFHARSRFYVVVKDPFPKYAISWQPVIAAAVCAAFVSFSLTTHPFSQNPNERPFEEGQLNRRKL